MLSFALYRFTLLCFFPPGLPLAPLYPGNLQAHSVTTCRSNGARAFSPVPAAASNNHNKHINLATASGQTRTKQHTDISLSLSVLPVYYLLISHSLSHSSFFDPVLSSVALHIFPVCRVHMGWAVAHPSLSSRNTKIIFWDTSRYRQINK